MPRALFTLLLAALLMGAPLAIYLGWRGRLGWVLLVVAVMMGLSVANYTMPDWYQGNFGSGEAEIGVWFWGIVGMAVTAAAGLVAFLLFLSGNGEPDRDLE